MRSIKIFLLAALIPLALTACVSKADYQRKADQAAILAASIEELEADYQSLVRINGDLLTYNEKVEAQRDEARRRNEGLEQDLVRARADLERIESVLTARDEETGEALAQMRQEIDRLETANRALRQEIEQERIAREARLAHLKSTYDELVEKMEQEISRGEITISELQGKLTVNMVESILFDSGKADIKPAGKEVLKRVGKILKGVDNKEVRVEGHTDNVPISPRLQDIFPSNWELSTARATNVVHFLQEESKISGSLLAACGYGEFRPIASNANAQGRAQNRRIQIVLAPLDASSP
ncbi:OmpA family protein [Desulfuromonas sp. AOP6]|uniref:OmpA family protein n=1 Tax=Desulfuromonas sp. AOP6 TaxID=1566351 RepID=UPI00126D3E84|nr:OmpA family protein [Desulfuromonas sp. AOP6]BCA79236.1 chemotaxis protein MotB [Desulfuromonas sp. AOP6]